MKCRVFAMLLAFGVALGATAQDFPKFGDELYQPQYGQSGKDVIWIPTPDALVTRMLQAVNTSDKDIVYDLGAGDAGLPRLRGAHGRG